MTSDDVAKTRERDGRSAVVSATRYLPDVPVDATALVALVTGLAVAPAAVPLRIDHDLFTAYAAAAAPNALRALASDIRAFDSWCAGQGMAALPATAAVIAAYLQARDDAGAAPASLSRYKASIARLHVLLGLTDPTRSPLVTLKLKAVCRARGSTQKQARPLRFKGAVRDVYNDAPSGVSLAGLLAGCPETIEGARDAALLSVAYDTGLRAAELVALQVADLQPAIDPDAGLVAIRRSKGDQDGEGATGYLSPRSMRALRAWRTAASIEAGPLFRRVFLRRIPARAAVGGAGWAHIEDGRLRHGRLPDSPAVPAHVIRTVGANALTPGALTGIYRRAAVRAHAAGHLPDLSRREFETWVAGLSAHSTRVGLTQDLFSAGEDLAGIMDALRWKTARMPLLYNRNLAAESGAAGRVVGKL